MTTATITKPVAVPAGPPAPVPLKRDPRYLALRNVAFYSALAVMTGVAFVLFTNYMISDPGTTPSKPRYQFMFGGTVAMTYGVLMVFNVVYTLFFATAITCGIRGAGWWGAHLLKMRAEKVKART